MPCNQALADLRQLAADPTGRYEHSTARRILEARLGRKLGSPLAPDEQEATRRLNVQLLLSRRHTA